MWRIWSTDACQENRATGSSMHPPGCSGKGSSWNGNFVADNRAAGKHCKCEHVMAGCVSVWRPVRLSAWPSGTHVCPLGVRVCRRWFRGSFLCALSCWGSWKKTCHANGAVGAALTPGVSEPQHFIHGFKSRKRSCRPQHRTGAGRPCSGQSHDGAAFAAGRLEPPRRR